MGKESMKISKRRLEKTKTPTAFSKVTKHANEMSGTILTHFWFITDNICNLRSTNQPQSLGIIRGSSFFRAATNCVIKVDKSVTRWG